MRLAGHVARTGDRTGAYKVLVGTPDGMSSQGRCRCRWDANIKVELQKMEWGVMDWIDLVQDRDRW